MRVRTLRLGIVLAGMTLAAAPALAQSPKEGGSPGGGGSAESRSTGGGGPANGGGGASNAGGGGGGAAASSSVGGFSSPSASAMTGSTFSLGARVRETAPARRTGYSAASSSNDGQRATPRSAAGSGSNSGGERAVPRGGSGSGNGDNNTAGGSRRLIPSDANNATGTREVPTWSRPRGDRPQTGTAVERVGPPPDRNGYRGRYYDPFYYGGYGGYYGYAPYGYNYGFGYGYYPYTWGLGYGLYSGFGWNPYFGDPFDPYYGGDPGAGYGSYSSGVYNTRDQGNLKLKVKPRNAKVYVDGYFVGLVDQFDGAFQKLPLNGGRHKVEVRADGYETAEFDVLITPDQTVTFQGELKRIQ